MIIILIIIIAFEENQKLVPSIPTIGVLVSRKSIYFLFDNNILIE